MKLKPVWGRLTILPDNFEETDEVYKSAKAAGIELPASDEKERLQHSQIRGTLLAVGGNCFEDWREPIPKVGDKVVFDKYAGFILDKSYALEEDINGQDVRLLADTDIMAVIGE